jgi:hypothetical protein
MYCLFVFAYIVILLMLMVLETYSIYEYRPYYNDYVFICDRDYLLSDCDCFYDYIPIALRDLEYILNM